MGGIRWFEMASSVKIDAPPEHVFQLVADARSWPKWSGVVANVADAPRGPWTPGDPLFFALRMAGRVVRFSVRVTVFDPPDRIAWASTKFTITAVRSLVFERDGDATRLTDHKHFSSPVLPIGVAYPRPLIRSMTEEWLADVKAEAERRRSSARPAPPLLRPGEQDSSKRGGPR